jgi:hypothetical protein
MAATADWRHRYDRVAVRFYGTVACIAFAVGAVIVAVRGW